MAKDFLKSSLFTPTAFSKKLLTNTQWRMSKLSNGKLQRLDKKSHQILKDSSDHVHSMALDHVHSKALDHVHSRALDHVHSRALDHVHSRALDHSLEYNTIDTNTFSDISNRGPGTSDYIHKRGNSPSSKNVKNEITINSHLTRSMLTSSLFNGLVRIPRPPNNPRQIRSSNSKSSCTSRREKVRRSVSQNLPSEANLFAGAEEGPLLETRPQKPFIQTRSQDWLHQQHLTLDQSNLKDPIENPKFIESSPKQDVYDQQYISQKNTLTPMYPNIQRNILPCLDNLSVNFCTQNFSWLNPENIVHNIITKDPIPQLTVSKSDNTSSVITHSSNENGDINIQSSDKIYKYSAPDDKVKLPQLQTEFDMLSLGTEKNYKCLMKKGFFNKISQTSYTETYKKHFSSFKYRAIERQGDLVTVDQSVHLKDVHFPKESVDEHANNNIDKNPNLNPKMSLNKRNKYFHLLRVLFGMRWKWKHKRDDKKPLVEQEITDEDTSRQDRTPKKDKSKKWSCRQALTKNKVTLINKWHLLSETKPMKHTKQSTVTKRKGRRPRKKNLYRARRRLRKNLGRGCRNIGYGFSYLIAEIPESPYIGPNGYNRCSRAEYNHNDRYDSNAPAPNCHKKRFITADLF